MATVAEDHVYKVVCQFLSALILVFAATPIHAAGQPPPPIPLHDRLAVHFDYATFVFHAQNSPDPILVTVQTQSPEKNDEVHVQSMQISSGKESIRIGSDMLADIESPNLLYLSVTALKIPPDDKTVIALNILDESDECAQRAGKPCGVIEFDWFVGEGVKKIDYR